MIDSHSPVGTQKHSEQVQPHRGLLSTSTSQPHEVMPNQCYFH